MATARELHTHSNIEIMSDPATWITGRANKATAADILAVGDPVMVDNSDGLIEMFDNANNTEFVGFLTHDTIGADVYTNEKCVILLQGIVRVKLDASGATFGQSLAVTTANTIANLNLGTRVDWVFTAAAAKGIGWAMEDIAANSYGLMYFSVFAQPGVGSYFVTQT